MVGLAIMAWLTVLICYGGNWVLGQCMIERPLVVGLVAGLLMGDVKTGVIIGASLEAIFMGAVNIGGAISAEPVAAIVNQIPANVMSGLNAVGALLPAVGMALLLQMLWSTELSIYFFLGFTLYQYLGLPMIAIAVLGVIIAVASALRDKEIFDLTKKGVATQAVSGDSVTSDEEDFFA